MGNQSKNTLSVFDAVPYTCYELGHTWDPNCFRVFLDSYVTSLKNALAIYIPYYTVSELA